jgi:hypothetical protein
VLPGVFVMLCGCGQGELGSFQSVAFSTDDRFVATSADDNTIRIVSATMHRLDCHTPHALCFKKLIMQLQLHQLR